MGIYTNKTPSKSLRAAFQKKSNCVASIKIAAAFFNYDEIVSELDKREVKIDLIVRLSEATSPDSLKKIYGLPNVQVRYYTSEKFHPKFYIFGDTSAIIGSANFTGSGFNSNNEICIEIPGGSEDFDNLAYIFQEYWDEAKALTPDVLKNYDSLHARFRSGGKEENLKDSILKTLGDHAPSTEIVVRIKKQNKKTLFIDDYERTYQVFEKAFRIVEAVYKNIGKRKIPENLLPLRIEIDQFFNFIRKEFTHGESYNEEPVRAGEDLEQFVAGNIQQWLDKDWPYIDTITTNYDIILRQFASEEKIDALSLEEIFDALDVCHAFHEQLRYHQGGLSAFKKTFLRESNEADLKLTTKYLLYGNGRYVERMANCIFRSYKVDFLSRYSIQELLGWVNSENIPICNTRTLKSLRYLGALSNIIPSISRTHGLKLEDH